MEGQGLEWRATTELRASGRRLVGYVARFGSEARIGRFTETVAQGAFARSLAGGHDILALADHDPKAVLGRTRTGTLRLREDAEGLAFELALPDTQHGRDLLALAERGDLGGMSFGFHVPEGGDHWRGDYRELRQVDLREVSVVQSFPAYGETSISLRSGQMAHLKCDPRTLWLETVR